MKKLVLAFLALAAVPISAQQPHRSTAPELVGSKWLNVKDDKPITLKGRAGKVTIVHFWTFACSNCQANLPAYNRLYNRFEKQGVEFIGIHTPELEFEKSESNVADAIKRRGIRYPVLLDVEGKNWMGWNQRYWPTIYVIDKNGRVFYYWEGELAYRGANGENQVINAITRALKEEPQAGKTGTS